MTPGAQPSTGAEPAPGSEPGSPAGDDGSSRWEGHHEWRIVGFPTLWQRGKKHYSDVFSVGGCPWRLSLYPKGNTAIKGSRDHVAVYLEAADAGSAPVGWRRFVEFKLAVVNKVGVRSSSSRSIPRSLRPTPPDSRERAARQCYFPSLVQSLPYCVPRVGTEGP